MTTTSSRTMLLKLGYPCIFLDNREVASATLFRLIANRECGFDEGPEQWRQLLRAISGKGGLANELNSLGASFSEHEWADILAGLLQRLESDSP